MAKDLHQHYLAEINRAYLRGDATEHTHRPALKKLIEGLQQGITATNEPKRVSCGAPDFVVSRKIKGTDQSFGYLECKDIGKDLKQEERNEQIQRYREGLDQFILTDYIRFRLYVGGEFQQEAILAKEGKGGEWIVTADGPEKFDDLFLRFFTAEPIRISSARILAEKMAGVSKLLRDIVLGTFQQEGDRGSLHEQYEALRDVLIHELSEAQFADMYAQTIVYGLFSARCFLNDSTIWGKDPDAVFAGIDGKRAEFTRQNAARLVPKTNPFLRKVFGHLELEIDDRMAWLVDDLVALLREAQMDRVLRDFAHETDRIDPVVHFYETFLSHYDPKLRETRGVYYTPEPVVDFIVRSVDELVKEQFGIKQGLADHTKIQIRDSKKQEQQVHRCLILDPAAGTGTFLFEVIRRISERFTRDKGAWTGYVRDHLLPRMFGFELMMAPYAICHMKLGLELRTLGYSFEGDERVGVYLTNTLEEAEEVSRSFWTQAVSEEARAANRVKQDLPIMIVLGNPPYSGHSANASWRMEGNRRIPTFIGKLIQDYYFVDGQPLKEKNPKWLQDDYVKFIRYGQYRIEQTGAGILAFITNHGYLDNPTFRGMRQNLMKTFSEIFILDLHGNSKKKEVCPDGSKDENVFDIQQGVSIGIFVKGPGKSENARVFHGDLWGLRDRKYEWLSKHSCRTAKLKIVHPSQPFYLFRSQSGGAEYHDYPRIPDIMGVNVLGFQTHRDEFAIAFEERTICKRIEEMRSKRMTDAEFAEKYGLVDNSGWELHRVRTVLRQTENWERHVRPLLYRPFDIRYGYFSDIMMDRPRRELLCHVAGKENLCLGVGRQGLAVAESLWSLVTLSHAPIDANVFRRGGVCLFPLYLYSNGNGQSGMDYEQWPHGKNNRIPNLKREYVESVAKQVAMDFVSDGRGTMLDRRIRGKAKRTFGPEDIFYYIYGLLHSPEYRRRYGEFLRIDFPRIPIPKNREIFIGIAEIGQGLVDLHLMESNLLDESKYQPGFPIEGDGAVEVGYPKFEEGDKRVYINSKQYFTCIETPIWEFKVGGYQVCEKWLKDRRVRQLSFDEINHYQKVVVALRETLRLMSNVDEVIDSFGGWPIG